MIGIGTFKQVAKEFTNASDKCKISKFGEAGWRKVQLLRVQKFFNWGLLSLSTIDLLGQVGLCGGVCPVPCRMSRASLVSVHSFSV